MILGPSFRLWGVDGVKDRNLFQNLHKVRFLELPGPQSRLSEKISKVWSTVLCIKVLRAIMSNLSKIGLSLSKGGEQVLLGRHFWKSRDLTSLAPPHGGGVEGELPKITLGESPFP